MSESKAMEWWLKHRGEPSDPYALAYNRALYRLRDLVSEAYWDSIPVTPQANTASKAKYERLVALKEMFPGSFEEFLGEAREELGLPRRKVKQNVRQRRRAAGIIDEPVEDDYEGETTGSNS